MDQKTETKEREIIVAIKMRESEYARLTRLISGEIILHATAKKSNVKAVVNSIQEVEPESEPIQAQMKRAHLLSILQNLMACGINEQGGIFTYVDKRDGKQRCIWCSSVVETNSSCKNVNCPIVKASAVCFDEQGYWVKSGVINLINIRKQVQELRDEAIEGSGMQTKVEHIEFTKGLGQGYQRVLDLLDGDGS